jgi:hypothetical protein
VIADQALTPLTFALVPLGAPHRSVVLPFATLIGCAGVLLMSTARTKPALRRDLERWLVLLAVGCAIIVTAYAVYVPAPVSRYQPLAKGSNDRLNAMA